MDKRTLPHRSYVPHIEEAGLCYPIDQIVKVGRTTYPSPILSNLPHPAATGLPYATQTELVLRCLFGRAPNTPEEKAQIAAYDRYLALFTPLWLDPHNWTAERLPTPHRHRLVWYNPNTIHVLGHAGMMDDYKLADHSADGRRLRGYQRKGYRLHDMWSGPSPPLPDCDRRKYIKDGLPPPSYTGTWVQDASGKVAVVTLKDGVPVGHSYDNLTFRPDACPEYPWGFKWFEDGRCWQEIHEKMPKKSAAYPFGWHFDKTDYKYYPRQSDPYASPAPQPLPEPPDAKPYGDNPPLSLKELIEIGAAHKLQPGTLALPSFLDSMPHEPILGVRYDEIGRQHLVTYPEDRGLVTTVPNRGGKNVSVIGPNAICHRGSFVAFDPKPELTRLYAHWRSEVLGQPTHVFDAFHVVDDADIPAPRVSDGTPPPPLRAGFNPLDMIARSKHPLADARMIAKTLNPVEGSDPFWSRSSASLFAASNLFTALDPRYPDARTYANMWRDLTQLGAEDFDGLLTVMESSSIPAVRGAVIQFRGAAENTRNSYLTTLRTQAGEVLNDPDVLACLSYTSLDFAQLQREKVSVFFVMPGKLAEDYAPFTRLLLACMFGRIEDAGLPPDGAKLDRTLIVLDEFATLGRSDALLKAMPRLPGFGVTIWPFVQDLSQLRTMYGDSGWESFTSNAGVLQNFGGSNDKFTPEYLSSKTGSMTETTVSDTSQTVGPGGSRSISSTGRPGMFPYEFSTLNAKRENKLKQILFYAGEGWTEAQRLLTYKDFPVWQTFADRKKAEREAKQSSAGMV